MSVFFFYDSLIAVVATVFMNTVKMVCVRLYMAIVCPAVFAPVKTRNPIVMPKAILGTPTESRESFEINSIKWSWFDSEEEWSGHVKRNYTKMV